MRKESFYEEYELEVNEVEEIEAFLNGEENCEFLEDVLYEEMFIIRKGSKFYYVDGNNDSYKFTELNEEEIEIVKEAM